MTSLRPRNIDFDTYWQTNCQQQFNIIFNQNQNHTVKLSAIQLYSFIYELCVSYPDNHVTSLLQNIGELFFQEALQIRKDLLKMMSPGTEPLEVLKLYTEGWKRYSAATKSVDGICRYLNKCLRSNLQSAHYPPSTIGSAVGSSIKINDEGKDVKLSISSVKDISNNVWHHVFLIYFQKNRSRFNNSNILVDSFLSALRVENANEEELKLFIESFNCCHDFHLLERVEEDTRDYFSSLSRDYISKNSISSYILFAFQRMSLERDRITRLWSSQPQAASIIISQCEQQLISAHISTIQSEFDSILRCSDINQLSVLFQLIQNNDDSITVLQKCLKNLILNDFNRNHNDNMIGSSVTLSPVDNLLKLNGKYSDLIAKAFGSNQIMNKSRQDAMDNIVNRDLNNNSSLLFSLFFDDFLRGRSAVKYSKQEISELIGEILIHLNSFDAFIENYKNKLGHRILQRKIDSLAEFWMLDTLKSTNKLTAEHFHHMKRMILDYQEQFDSVTILTSHAWPSVFNPTEFNNSLIPASLTNLMSEFESEYKEVHCGRKLLWCPHLITLETSENTIMSLQQYQILQSLPCKDLNEISVKIGVKDVIEINRALLPLQNHHIIINDANGHLVATTEALPSNLNLLPEVQLNISASSSTINPLADEVGLGESESEMNASLLARQNFILQSLIVSILKRKHQVSPAELTKLLLAATKSLQNGHAFVPKTEETHSAVEALTSKGFIEYIQQRNLYIYLA